LGRRPLFTRESRHARRSVECSGSPRLRLRARVRVRVRIRVSVRVRIRVRVRLRVRVRVRLRVRVRVKARARVRVRVQRRAPCDHVLEERLRLCGVAAAAERGLLGLETPPERLRDMARHGEIWGDIGRCRPRAAAGTPGVG